MPRLNVEHFACNVSDPVAMAAWYVEHLDAGRSVEICLQHIHFMADANGWLSSTSEYTADLIPDYASMHPSSIRHRVRG